MKKLFLAAALAAASFQPASCHLTPQEQIEIVKSPEFQIILARCAEIMKNMGQSAVIIIQTILRDAGPKVAEAVKTALRALGYPV